MRKPQSRPMTRRRLIGTALAGTALARTAVPSAGWAQTTEPARKEDRMTVRFAFNGQTFTAVLDDNPTARDFASQLPLDLTISDYSTNEKIARWNQGGAPVEPERREQVQGCGPLPAGAPLRDVAPGGAVRFG